MAFRADDVRCDGKNHYSAQIIIKMANLSVLCQISSCFVYFQLYSAETLSTNNQTCSGVARVIVWGGGGKMRAPKARAIVGRPAGMLPRENFEI